MIIRIEVSDETLQAINDGKYVDGSIRLRELVNGKKGAPYIFRHFHRKPRVRARDKTLFALEQGWVKESALLIKYYSSVKKELGMKEVAKVLEREMKEAVKKLKNEE